MGLLQGVLLHGDAAFSGLGLPAEVMQLSNLPEYTTGGTIHLIINNQIGFTTDPKLARSSPHPSDVAKGVGAPIFHVNGDDPQAVCQACELAVEYRQRFLSDVVVDIVCYRRHGHNEQDDPSVTMPLTYKKIATHPTTLQIYSQQLLQKGLASAEMIKNWTNGVEKTFEAEYEEAGKYETSLEEWLSTNWQGDALGTSTPHRYILPTGVPFETLYEVGRAVSRVPEGFNLHPDVELLLKNRAKMIETGKGVDWAMAEALAFGSLMMVANPELGQTPETYPHYYVRLSGQDCERGTFNQRHAVLYDQKTSRRYVPLNNIAKERQATFLICNSSLSEAAILGFEYGFSLGNEDALVLWEAQFGDFANNAQSIIDNFIASGEDKWMTPTALVMLLPHGYDGQGPEHSSARLERFLQLSNDDPDHLPGLTPQHQAEIEAGFSAADRDGKGYLLKEDLMRLLETMKGIDHDRAKELLHEKELDGSQKIEREQWVGLMVEWMRRNAERDHNMRFAKPLVVMSPKFLLHHSACRSKLADFDVGTYFRRVIVDGDKGDNLRHLAATLVPREDIRRVILCSGKEEPKNMGAWAYVQPRVATAQRELFHKKHVSYSRPGSPSVARAGLPVRYIGRSPSASTATGSSEIHQEETKAIISAALRLNA
ncbi:hypothetical protein CBR_g23813 [Chara braunii]|uniref:EF-hand domain-containing protein n=1 Tax=Chara braunii TaxID=69332 RepID=A0A388JVQ2_CHABU|nr:hypothetical protein CBR_g23813 [Chara braunii]|eukprot:GBG61860.1 hypothetical protein CBR_g23813 [Chara braunii]